jgi:hypothetical protein
VSALLLACNKCVFNPLCPAAAVACCLPHLQVMGALEARDEMATRMDGITRLAVQVRVLAVRPVPLLGICSTAQLPQLLTMQNRLQACALGGMTTPAVYTHAHTRTHIHSFMHAGLPL